MKFLDTVTLSILIHVAYFLDSQSEGRIMSVCTKIFSGTAPKSFMIFLHEVRVSYSVIKKWQSGIT